MKVQVTDTVITVTGRLDSTTYSELQEVVNQFDYSKGELVFDFKDLDYVSSSGLRVMLSAKKKMGAGSFKIINASSDVFEVFKTTGFDSIIDIEQGEEGIATYINLSFKELLKQKAKSHSDTLIVSHLGIEYTWGEIEKCAQIVANDLSKQGVKTGTHVGICSANSANWIITFLAVQKLGAIACLLNFNYNEKEIADVSEVGDITHLCYGEISQMKDETFLSNIIEAANSRIKFTYDMSSSNNYKERFGEYDAIAGMFDGKTEADDACMISE